MKSIYRSPLKRFSENHICYSTRNPFVIVNETQTFWSISIFTLKSIANFLRFDVSWRAPSADKFIGVFRRQYLLLMGGRVRPSHRFIVLITAVNLFKSRPHVHRGHNIRRFSLFTRFRFQNNSRRRWVVIISLANTGQRVTGNDVRPSVKRSASKQQIIYFEFFDLHWPLAARQFHNAPCCLMVITAIRHF